MLRIKYFAYGSNLDIGRLRFRVQTRFAPVNKGTVYTLQNYRFAFNTGAYFSFANVVPAIGESVEGVLYDLTPGQLKELDRYEALYEKHFFYVDENSVGCVYIAQESVQRETGKPSLEYLNTIIDGCKDYGLTRTYNRLIKYKLNNYKIKKNKHKIIADDKDFQWRGMDSRVQDFLL